VVNALRAAAKLSEKGISARVLSMHTVKPIDGDAVIRAAEETGRIVTVEEHNTVGGLGSAVTDLLVERLPEARPRLRRLAIPDAFTEHYGSQAELLRRFASVQIRNVATLGGNIANASPIGDSMPALMALGSSLVLRRGARRRELPLEDFFTGYRQTALASGEFIERIDIPLEPQRRFAVYKISKRFDQDISGVLGAFSALLKGGRASQVRLCFGGMAATPKRARAAERALEGADWSAAAIEIAAQALAADFEPISDMRASADYRMLVARNLLGKFWMETTGQAGDLNTALYGRPA